MAKSPVTDNSYVQLTFKCADNELVALKRAKKEPGALTGKSVVVLKPCDVVERDGTVFMPNTIEMAQLKKSEKGQFKTNVQISSKMTEMDIKRILVETFPFLANKRFYCAGAADNRTRLDFHGEPRIWDGRLIKQKIKGNSALYIFTDKESVDEHDLKVPKFSEVTTLKRSHDQITAPENEMAEHSSKKEGASEGAVEHLTVHPRAAEKHAKLLAASDSPKNVAGYAIVGTFHQEGLPTKFETTMEKSDHPNQIDGQSQLRQKLSDRVAGVSSQHGVMLPVSHSGRSVQGDMNAREIGAAIAPMSSHSMSVAPIMVPQMVQGMVLDQRVLVPKFVSTASDQQGLGKSVFHLTNSHVEARHTGLPLLTHVVPQTGVSSTLAPQMNSLKISKGLPQQPVFAVKRDQSAQTDEESHGLTATASQVHSSEPSDSGIETGDSIGVNDEDTSQSSKKVIRDAAVEAGRLGKRVDRLEEAGWSRSNIKEERGLYLLSDAAVIDSEVTDSEVESAVIEECLNIEIYPRSSPLRGGGYFMIVFEEHLPPDVTGGVAFFGNLAQVTLEKQNEFNLFGKVPAADEPGRVPVNVRSCCGRLLGRTFFEYVDEVEDVLLEMVRDYRLQARYFKLLARELENRETNRNPTSEPNNIDATDLDKGVSTACLIRQAHVLRQLLASKRSGNENWLATESREYAGGIVDESGYDAGDEDSLEENDYCYAGNLNKNYKNLSWKATITDLEKTNGIVNSDSYLGLVCAKKLPTSQVKGTARIQNITRLDSSPKRTSNASSSIPDKNNEEQIIGHMNCLLTLLNTGDVTIKETLENVSSNLQESEPAISRLDSKALTFRDETKTGNFVPHVTEKWGTEMTKNTENVLKQFVFSDSDENSLSDKSRRAYCVKRRNQVSDTPAKDL